MSIKTCWVIIRTQWTGTGGRREQRGERGLGVEESSSGGRSPHENFVFGRLGLRCGVDGGNILKEWGLVRGDPD